MPSGGETVRNSGEIPRTPHRITQRGNRRQQVFFNDGDYAAYVELLAEWCGEHGVEMWSYCLMPNHIQLIAAPSSEDGLRWAIGETHQRYTRRINFREKWRAYLWQGRFASFVMDGRVKGSGKAPVKTGMEERMADLHGRVHRGAYRAQPSKRAWIPKADGRQRPLGIAALEDKIVQQAVKTVLEQIYEEDFLGFSYGFRPERSGHNALAALWVGITHRKVNWVLDADIRGFLDHASGCPLKNASYGAFRR